VSDIVAVVIQNPEQPIRAILAPGIGEVAAAVISQIGPDGLSGYSGFSGFSGYSGFSGKSGFSGFSGFSGDPAHLSGYSGYSSQSGFSGFRGSQWYTGDDYPAISMPGPVGLVVGDMYLKNIDPDGGSVWQWAGVGPGWIYTGADITGQSGFSGFSGNSGYSGFCGLSGYSGFCGASGFSGFSGQSGYSGFCGLSGYSGFCGLSGYSGFSGSGISGYSGYSGSGTSGYSGFCGLSGYSGFSSTSGYSGFSSTSGYSGFCGLSGYSGFSGSGLSGYSGFSGAGLSGFSGYCGLSGYSGFCGLSGYSGFSGKSGYSGFSGITGADGASGFSGYSGDPAQQSGYSGFSGKSGYSGFSSVSGFSGYSGTIGIAGTQPYWFQDTASDIGTYNDILTTPESGTEATASAVCNNNQVLIQAYASPSIGLGLFLIPSGEWTFDFFASVNSLSLASDLVIKIYSRTSGGSETLLFTTTSPTFTSTSLTEYEWSIIQPEYAVNTTDRLVVKVYGETAIPLNTTVSYTYLGQTHYSRIITSFTPVGISGFSGYSGFSGKSGYSGFCGLSGYSGFCGLSGYSGFCGLSGYSGYCGLSGYSGFSGFSAVGLTVSLTQPYLLQHVGANTVVTKGGTITGTAGIGSSLFLQRIFIPGTINLSEIDVGIKISFNTTSDGAGTMSRSMAIYSFGNSTSLGSVASFSATSSWGTGTATAGASSSITQFQGGWTSANIQPMTFAASSIAASEYVIGQLFNFNQASSSWSISLYGIQGVSTQSAVLAVGSSTDTAQAGSVAAGSGITGISSYASQFLALSTAGSLTQFVLSQTASVAASSTSAAINSLSVAGSFTNTAKSISFQLKGESSNSNIVSSVGTVAGSIFTSTAVISALTSLSAALGGPFVINNPVGLGFPSTGSTTFGISSVFQYGLMSTGAIPTAITLTSAAVTYTGSLPARQPWFALIGS
jgi:collagen type IV alpha